MFGNLNLPGMEDFYKALEKNISDWMEKSLTSPEVLKNIGKSMDSTLTSKSFIEKFQNQVLKSSSLPTSEQFSRLGQQILRIEGKQGDIEDILFEHQDQISVLNEKLDKVIGNQELLIDILNKINSSHSSEKEKPIKKAPAKKKASAKSSQTKTTTEKKKPKKTGGEK